MGCVSAWLVALDRLPRLAGPSAARADYAEHPGSLREARPGQRPGLPLKLGRRTYCTTAELPRQPEIAEIKPVLNMC